MYILISDYIELLTDDDEDVSFQQVIEESTTGSVHYNNFNLIIFLIIQVGRI